MSDDKRDRTPKDSHYARLRRTHREQSGRTAPPRPGYPSTQPTDGSVWLYGLHTVKAAIENPRRRINRMLVTRNALQRLEIEAPEKLPFPVELVEPRSIDALTGSDAVHQGVLVMAAPLKTRSLGDLGDSSLVLILDQVTDPHNVGAIMRSAVAFGVDALITTARHSPDESGVLAKAASGALEYIEHLEVRNLAEAIAALHDAGFFTIGLDSEGPLVLEETFAGDKIALVLGSEGKGLRQKTRETVRALARLDMPGVIRSLNVSNASAVAIYAARNHLKR